MKSLIIIVAFLSLLASGQDYVSCAKNVMNFAPKIRSLVEYFGDPINFDGPSFFPELL
jgi:hypothetical protein